MSRIGRKPVALPKGVTAQIDGHKITVKGPKGEISRTLHEAMAISQEDGSIMVQGVTEGFAKSLEIQGVGYKAEPKPFGVQLVVGFSHPVPYHTPKGIKITVTNNVQLKIEGVDKELVGQVASELRNVRPPEPYKGKGIRYAGEQVRRKAGKTAQAAK